jgi:hypothetical protein
MRSFGRFGLEVAPEEPAFVEIFRANVPAKPQLATQVLDNKGPA